MGFLNNLKEAIFGTKPVKIEMQDMNAAKSDKEITKEITKGLLRKLNKLVGEANVDKDWISLDTQKIDGMMQKSRGQADNVLEKAAAKVVATILTGKIEGMEKAAKAHEQQKSTGDVLKSAAISVLEKSVQKATKEVQKAAENHQKSPKKRPGIEVQ